MMVIALNICGDLDEAKEIVSLEMTNEGDAPPRVISCSASPTDNSVAVDTVGRFARPRKAAYATADTHRQSDRSIGFLVLESGIIEARGAEPYAPSVVFSRIIDPPQRNDVVAQRN
jgi:hypothetical protein